MSRFKTLDQIVRNICSMIGDTQNEGYVRVARLAVQVLEEVNLMGIPQVKTVQVEIGDNLTATLPDDLILVSKVGNVDGNGNIYLMGRDDRIRRVDEYERLNPVSCDDVEPVNIPTFVPQERVVFYNYYNYNGLNRWGEYIGERYGVIDRHFLAGTYRYNSSLNILEFGSGYDIVPGNKVFVEYKATMGDDVHRLVPLEWETAIQYRTLQHLTAAKDPPASAAHHRQFIREYYKVKRLLQTMTIQDWQAAIEEARYGAVKF